MSLPKKLSQLDDKIDDLSKSLEEQIIGIQSVKKSIDGIRSSLDNLLTENHLTRDLGDQVKVTIGKLQEDMEQLHSIFQPIIK